MLPFLSNLKLNSMHELLKVSVLGQIFITFKIPWYMQKEFKKTGWKVRICESLGAVSRTGNKTGVFYKAES